MDIFPEQMIKDIMKICHLIYLQLYLNYLLMFMAPFYSKIKLNL